MKSAFWRVAALALIVALVPSMAFAAGEVARSAMAGSNFMNTSADSWIFFQRNVEGGASGELVSEGYDEDGDTYGSAFGRLVLPIGDYILGFELNDEATGSNLVDYSWNGGPFSRVFTIGDFTSFFGPSSTNAFYFGQMMTVKAAGALGTGALSVGGGYYNNTDEDNDAEINNEATGFNLNASWGNGAPKTQGTIEIAGEFTTHSSKVEDTPTPANDAELSGTHFGVNARYSMSDDSHFEGAFIMLSSDFEDAATTSLGITAFRVAYARDLVEETDRAAVIEVGVDYVSQSFEPDGASEATASAFSIPNCRFSAWNNVGSHFRVYGGVAGRWFTESEEDESGSFFDVDSSYKGDGFFYTAGLGYMPNDNLSFDIYVLTDNIANFLSLHGDENAPIVGGFGASASF